MLNERSKQVRRDAIALSKANGGYHYGGSFSCAEILIALFDSIMNKEDRFVQSKGHGCWVYYVLLRELGLNPTLEGHPHYEPENGIYCTAGSMGHGLPVSIGMAKARKLKGEKSKVYTLMGDGECQEGTTWESILIAGHLKLDNLVVIVDNNKIQGSGRTGDIMPIEEPLMSAAACAGWDVVKINGHNNELIECFADEMFHSQKKPILIIADTIKGKGVSFMEDQPSWHSNWMGPELEEQALEELS